MANNVANYVPFSRSVRNVHQATMSMLYTLADEGRSDLGAPLADILKALAQLDSAALDAIDRSHGEVPPKRTETSG